MKGCYIIILVVERNENKTQGYALLAQLVEQRTLNPSVQGSNPCVPTTPPNDPADRWSAGFFFVPLFPSGGNTSSIRPFPRAFAPFAPHNR